MAYDNQQNYAKHLAKKCGSESCSDSCGCSKNDECGCCPPGLVAVYKDGKHVGCLTPNDAENYQEETGKLCAPGYVALYNNATNPPTFMGCVTEDSWAALNDSLNGSDVAPEGISIVPSGDLTVGVGGTLQLYARFDPLNTTNQNVLWSSSDITKATVDSNGLVTGVATGAVVITAISAVNSAITDTQGVTVTT